MSEMDALIGLTEKLASKVMTDAEVDNLVQAAEVYGKLFKEDENIQHAVEYISDKAKDVKLNISTEAIDKVADSGQLKQAVNIFDERAQKTGIRPENTEQHLAQKLSDMADNSNAKEVFDIGHKLIDSGKVLDNGDDEDRANFAGNIASAYAVAAGKMNLSSGQAKIVLGDLASLSEHLDYPADAFVLDNLPLDDKKTAEAFVKYTEKALQQTDEQGKDVINGDALIKQFTEVVAHHPEMAKKCGELVKKTADLQGSGGMGDAYDEAHNYFEQVQGMKGVSFDDKCVAGREKVRFDHLAQKAKRREAEQEQSQQQTQHRTTEIDFRQIDFGEMER